MKRVLVIGGSAAGKSTVAKGLGEILKVEVTHLDKVLWREGCRLVDKAEEAELVRPLLAPDRWIIDGNYTESLPMRLQRADTVVIVDAARPRMFWGALRRLIKHRGKTRPSMGGDCVEEFNFEFLRWIWNYPRHERPVLLEQVRQHGRHATVITLRTRRQIEKWLDDIRDRPRDHSSEQVSQLPMASP